MKDAPNGSANMPVVKGKLPDNFVPEDGRTLTGSPIDWIKGVIPSKPGAECDVPCGACNACCRDSMPVPITSGVDDTTKLKTKKRPGGRGLVLRKRADGSCVHLVDGACDVREHRPLECRAYDCRFMVFFGVAPNTIMGREVIDKWLIELPTADDVMLHKMLRNTAHAVMSANPSMPIDEVVTTALSSALTQCPHLFNAKPALSRASNQDSKGSAPDHARESANNTHNNTNEEQSNG